SIVQKQDQGTGKTTQGIVKDILTRSLSHPHGIKVRLVSGEVGRVKQIATADPDHSAEQRDEGGL
ncbi:MAG: YwbE family protein, partial [Dehalococcoidia bacterium]|nr:YwbE family protein [Dehalococcoidia bacterium]